MGLIHGLSWSLTRRKETVSSSCNASVSDSLETRSKRLNPNEMREIVIRAINIILKRVGGRACEIGTREGWIGYSEKG